jgi:hypothetical protein
MQVSVRNVKVVTIIQCREHTIIRLKTVLSQPCCIGQITPAISCQVKVIHDNENNLAVTIKCKSRVVSGTK